MNLCCKNCKDYDNDGGLDCITLSCSCHSTPSPIGWEEEFEMAFNTPHSQMAHIGNNQKKKDCEICKESRLKNPKRYYKTFLQEQNCYWNDDMFQDVKSFIRQTLSQEREKIVKMLEGMLKDPKEERQTDKSLPRIGTKKLLGFNQALTDAITRIQKETKKHGN